MTIYLGTRYRDVVDTSFTTTGDDVLFGRGGNDSIVLDYSLGNDVLLGGQGDDALYDIEGWNVVSGGRGNDNVHGSGLVLGGRGNDDVAVYHGGRGNGGPGDDLLYSHMVLVDAATPVELCGGKGADTFEVWFFASDTASRVDILDFNRRAGDKIDLHDAFADGLQFQRFDNNGDGFLNAADGQDCDSNVIYDPVSNSLGLIAPDLDQVWIHGRAELAASDFIV